MKEKKRLLRLATIFVSAIVFVSAMGQFFPARAGERKNVSFGFSFEGNTGGGGQGSAELRELMTLVVRDLMKKTGYNFHVDILPTWKDLLKKIGSGKVDLAFMYPPSYLQMKTMGAKIDAFAAMDYGFGVKTCIYVNKNSGISSLKALNGKRMSIATSYIKRIVNFPSSDRFEYIAQESLLSEFMELRYMLEKTKIGSLEKSGIIFNIDFPNPDSRLIALDKGMIDAAILNNGPIDMLRASGRSLNNIKTLSCSEEYFAHLIVKSERITTTQSDKIGRAAVEMLRNPNKEIQALIDKMNVNNEQVKIVSITDADLKYWFDLYEAYEKNNWRPEIEKVVKKLIEDSKTQ
jgi:ABC-type phosphate/phosphonate transport system substrate-binding protein